MLTWKYRWPTPRRAGGKFMMLKLTLLSVNNGEWQNHEIIYKKYRRVALAGTWTAVLWIPRPGRENFRPKTARPGLRKFQTKTARPEKISDLNGPARENFRPKRPGLRIIPQDLQHCCTGVFCFNIYPSIIFLIWLIEAFLTGHIRFLWNPCLDILTLIVKNSSKITNRIFEFFGKTPVPTVFTVPRHIICHKCLCFFS